MVTFSCSAGRGFVRVELQNYDITLRKGIVSGSRGHDIFFYVWILVLKYAADGGT